jgi:serine/threonine-protein kinase
VRTLGKYELSEEIGQGGMSVVYRGRDTVLGREVAIKIMHPFLAQRAEAKRRFYREAMAVARLHHPNIVEIYDYSGEAAEQAYIVTEYIRGETLASFAGRVDMRLPEIGFLIIAKLAGALAHAHAQGIIHRDLKPENIMIGGDGVLKLMDFGIAQMVDADTLTTTGALLGSPAHMSPELIEGEPCDIRADIFSLGTILYWLITRRLPFTAPTAPALFKKIAEASFDDPRLHNPQISAGMLRILTRLLKKKPAERYPDVGALIRDIVSELASSGIEHPDADLGEFLREPDAFQQRLIERISERLRASGSQALARGDIAAALTTYDRLLLLHPDDVALREQVLSLGRRQRRRERARLVIRGLELSAGTLALSAAFVVLGWSLVTRGDRSLDTPPTTIGKRPDFRSIEVPPAHVAALGAATKKDAPPPPAVALPPRAVEFRVLPFGTLTIDGQVVAQDLQKPLNQSLVPGPHVARAENPFREPVELKLNVKETGTIDPVILRLDRFRPALLKIRADTGAQAVIDGEAKGPAALSEKDPFRIPMAQGERWIEVKVVKDGRTDKSERVLLRAGQLTEREVHW